MVMSRIKRDNYGDLDTVTLVTLIYILSDMTLCKTLFINQ